MQSGRMQCEWLRESLTKRAEIVTLLVNERQKKCAISFPPIKGQTTRSRITIAQVKVGVVMEGWDFRVVRESSFGKAV